jgi:hypothetical protein
MGSIGAGSGGAGCAAIPAVDAGVTGTLEIFTKARGGAILRIKIRAWTPEDDDLLKRYIGEGVSPCRLAIRLKRSERSVRVRAAALNLKLPTKSEIRVKNGLAVRGQGTT